MMNSLGKAKEVVKEYFENAAFGIFNSRNIFGDEMETVYEDKNLTIDICYGYSYFEVFGLTDNEFKELEEYYDSLSLNENEE